MRESGLLATCLPIIMPAVVVVVVVVSQETTLHKFKLQSFPPFLTPPPLPISFLFFFSFWGGAGGGDQSRRRRCPPKGGWGGRSPPHPPFITIIRCNWSWSKINFEIYIYWLGKCVWPPPPPLPPPPPPPPPPGLRHDGDRAGKIHRNISIKDCYRWYCTGDR